MAANELLFESHCGVKVTGSAKIKVKFPVMKLEENSGVRGNKIPMD